jgi:peptidoglycan/xylan/chitin deacetylase (PgdA/CDA1 family)
VSATGKKTTLFRPIGGFINERIVNLAKEQGYTVVLWSWHQDTEDWRRPGVTKIMNKVVHNVRNGDIVLYHDHGGDRSQTVQALKQILPRLQQKGYKFVTVSELLQMKTK